MPLAKGMGAVDRGSEPGKYFEKHLSVSQVKESTGKWQENRTESGRDSSSDLRWGSFCGALRQRGHQACVSAYAFSSAQCTVTGTSDLPRYIREELQLRAQVLNRQTFCNLQAEAAKPQCGFQ